MIEFIRSVKIGEINLLPLKSRIYLKRYLHNYIIRVLRAGCRKALYVRFWGIPEELNFLYLNIAKTNM